jgi:hypothetical protein
MKDLAVLILYLNGTTFQGQKYEFFHQMVVDKVDKVDEIRKLNNKIQNMDKDNKGKE